MEHKKLIMQYLEARKGLENLGIVRTKRGIEGDYAEWAVAEKLKLELAENPVQKGFDAIDNDGKRYQIKSRLEDKNTSFDIKDIHSESARFDYLICVFLTPKNLEIARLIKLPYNFVVDNVNSNKSSFRFRWNKDTQSLIKQAVDAKKAGFLDWTNDEI